MSDIYFIINEEIEEAPVNILPLIDDTDFKTRETSANFNVAGLDLSFNFVNTSGTFTQTSIVPSSAGNYLWVDQGSAMYTVQIPATGGSTINNDSKGIGWFTGIATGILPWRGPTMYFRSEATVESDIGFVRGVAVTDIDDFKADVSSVSSIDTKINSISGIIDTINTNVVAVSGIVSETNVRTTLVKRILANKMVIDETNSRIVIYDDDGTDIILSATLTDKDGSVIVLGGRGPVSRTTMVTTSG